MPELNTQRTSSPQDTRLHVFTSIVLLVALLFTRSYSYLLFHSLAEMMTIAFACANSLCVPQRKGSFFC